MKNADKKKLYMVAESLAIQMIRARAEARKLPKGRGRDRMLQRFEILKALGL